MENFKKIHERWDAPGGQVFSDEPLCAVPVKAFGGVTNARKMNTCFVGKSQR